MSFGIIGRLLTSFASAQDLPTMEERAAWLIEQYRDESIKPNAKHGPAVALARLSLNPDDDYVIDRITHYYDELSTGRNGEQFSYYGIAWVLGKYWESHRRLSIEAQQMRKYSSLRIQQKDATTITRKQK